MFAVRTLFRFTYPVPELRARPGDFVLVRPHYDKPITTVADWGPEFLPIIEHHAPGLVRLVPKRAPQHTARAERPHLELVK